MELFQEEVDTRPFLMKNGVELKRCALTKLTRNNRLNCHDSSCHDMFLSLRSCIGLTAEEKTFIAQTCQELSKRATKAQYAMQWRRAKRVADKLGMDISYLTVANATRIIMQFQMAMAAGTLCGFGFKHEDKLVRTCSKTETCTHRAPCAW